jgi:DNA-binding protein HU-beta
VRATTAKDLDQPPMTKSEFIKRLAANHFQSQKQAAESLEAITAAIGDALAEGETITLTGFGKFHVAQRGARRGVNPRTGEPITIPGGPVPRFTAGTTLKARVKP